MLEAWQQVGDGAPEGRAGRGLGWGIGGAAGTQGLRGWGPYQGPPTLTGQSSIHPHPLPATFPSNVFSSPHHPLLLSWDLG